MPDISISNPANDKGLPCLQIHTFLKIFHSTPVNCIQDKQRSFLAFRLLLQDQYKHFHTLHLNTPYHSSEPQMQTTFSLPKKKYNWNYHNYIINYNKCFQSSFASLLFFPHAHSPVKIFNSPIKIFYLRNVYKLYSRFPIIQSVITERIVISAGKIS